MSPGLGMMVTGALGTIASAWMLQRVTRSRAWPKVPGLFLEISCRRNTTATGGDTGNQYEVHALYEYTVDGKPYRGESIYPVNVLLDHETAKRVAASIARSPQVRFNPSNPSESHLLPAPRGWLWIAFTASVVMLGLGLLISTQDWSEYMKEKQTSKTVDTTAPSKPTDATLPIVTSLKQLEPQQGQEIELRGIYQELNVSQLPDKPVFSGRAAILLENGDGVGIERDENGIRSKAELERFRGKHVRVLGRYIGNLPLWGGGQSASLAAPCIDSIRQIEEISKARPASSPTPR